MTDLVSGISDTVLIGAIAGAVAVWGITTQRYIARQRATFDWVFSIAEHDGWMEPHVKTFNNLVKQPGGLIYWAKSGAHTADERHSVHLVLNRHEGFAIGVSTGVIDYEVFTRLNTGSTLRYWEAAQAYVYLMREVVGEKSLGLEFEVLADRIARTGKFPKNYLEGDFLTRFWMRQNARLYAAQTERI